ncbi:1432_t:CDS:2, partial [Dentiscutata erythropus]
YSSEFATQIRKNIEESKKFTQFGFLTKNAEVLEALLNEIDNGAESKDKLDKMNASVKKMLELYKWKGDDGKDELENINNLEKCVENNEPSLDLFTNNVIDLIFKGYFDVIPKYAKIDYDDIWNLFNKIKNAINTESLEENKYYDNIIEKNKEKLNFKYNDLQNIRKTRLKYLKMYYNILSSLDCMIEILQDKKYINKKINFNANLPNDLLSKLENEKQTRLNQSIKILENIKILITKTRVPSDLEPNNTVYKKIKHKDSCLTFYDKEILRRIGEIIDIIYDKVLNEINNIKNLEDFIIDSYGHGKLTENILALEMIEYIDKIIFIHEENSIVYYQVIINRMNASTNKEDFKDWGKKNYKISEPVVPPVIPEEDYRLPYEKVEITEDHVTRIREWLIQKRDYRGKADTFDTIMDDFWGLINGRKFQQETDTHTLDFVKEI